MSDIVVLASLQAKPGRGDELLALLAELVPPILRSEPDLHRYAFYIEPGSDPLRVTVIEKYASAAAKEVHDNGALTDYLPRLLDLIDPAPQVVELRPAPLVVDLGEDEAARLTI
ncbi:quinol monooxygenase YgiN [Nocardia tenerifensis]|uniref:Quinol monooxygenase YgiN n=1 Tax=Nocardia tenerifensis TaxID=228006 RepID=A0A318KF04_9NOCA|nr:antibiotic biosynthesis monooxygenase [Nocardia tenerifensis]PXX58127.1 quinol monooxygenase YgiN [Nocardia tenerifensis]